MLHLNLVLIYCLLLFMNYYLISTSLCLYFSFNSHNLGRLWGITDDFATIPFHLVLFSAALVELAKIISVHSLILSFISSSRYLFFFLCPRRNFGGILKSNRLSVRPLQIVSQLYLINYWSKFDETSQKDKA